MAFAVAYRKVGVILLEGMELTYCDISTKAAKECGFTKKFAQDMIAMLKPDIVITEDIEAATHKGQHTKQVTSVIADIAENSDALDVSVARERRFKNKYEEAAHYVAKYPQLAPLEPKPRRLFDKEPRTTVIFEAVALAEAVRRNPAPQLAIAMG
jgi:hypothetical protein